MNFFDIAEKTADAMPAAMNFPIPDICAQYLGELNLVVSKLIPVEELTQINLAGNNGSQAIVDCQSNVLLMPVLCFFINACTRESFGNLAWHSIRMYSMYVK